MRRKTVVFLERVLRLMAMAVIARHRPKIVAITGSVGKTSASMAVSAVLAARFRVRDGHKNHNDNIGVPFTIIGAETGGRSISKMVMVLNAWLSALVSPDYPEILVLELGVDHVGDMSYFMSFIRPAAGVVTNISHSHLENFGSVDSIAQEKGLLVEALDAEGFAVLNVDDERVARMAQRTKARVVGFAQMSGAGIKASRLTYNDSDGRPAGISLTVSCAGGSAEIRLPHVLAAHQVYAILAGVAAGIAFGIDLPDIVRVLEDFQSPTGRMNLLEGVNGSLLIDDTYNASPVSTVAALGVLGELRAERKLAVLGDMLELGPVNEDGHRAVGEKVSACDVDLFVAVGKRMEMAASELVSRGFPASRILQFPDPDSTAEHLAKVVKAGDLLLVKGSQGMRMEKIVERLLADPGKAGKVLCRQSDFWKNKPFAAP